MDPHFTRLAWNALGRAADHAVERQQRAIEPRHVLLGIVESGGAGTLVLADVGAAARALSDALDDSLPRRQDPGSSARPSDLPYTPRADEILDRAREEARDDGRDRVGTADLVLALAAEKGITRTILRQFGVTEDSVRAARASRQDEIGAEDRDEAMEAGPSGPRAAPEDRDPVRSGEEDGQTPGPPEARSTDDGPEGEGVFGSVGDTGDDWAAAAPTSDLEDALRRSFASPAEERKASEAAPEVPEEGSDETAMLPDAGEGAAPSPPEDEPVPPRERTRGGAEPPSDRREAERATSPPSPQPGSGVAMDSLSLDEAAQTPLYRQIADGVEEAVATGDLEPGSRLPSIRDAATALSVSAGTVARAYRSLEDRDVVVTRGTRGTFVAARSLSPTGEEVLRELAEGLRSTVVAAYHRGLGPEEMHRALDLAMDGILLADGEPTGPR